jgi:hypothetical protein
MEENLWGEIELEPYSATPLDILSQQAVQLGRMTNNIVLGSIETLRTAPKFRFSFNLVAPVLEGYTYSLFWLEHGLDPYPVEITIENERSSIYRDENEFKAVLRQELSSPTTHNVIRSLVNQSKAVTPSHGSPSMLDAITSDPNTSALEQVNVSEGDHDRIAATVLDAVKQALRVSAGEVILRMNPATWNRLIPNVSAAFFQLSSEAQASITYRCNRRQDPDYIGIALFEIAGDVDC